MAKKTRTFEQSLKMLEEDMRGKSGLGRAIGHLVTPIAGAGDFIKFYNPKTNKDVALNRAFFSSIWNNIFTINDLVLEVIELRARIEALEKKK